MSEKQFAVFGIHSNFQALRTGVDTLKAVGVRIVDISVLFPETAVARTLPRQSDAHPIDLDSGKKKPGIEPLIGGTLGWLVYINPQGRDIVSDALISLGGFQMMKQIVMKSASRMEVCSCAFGLPH